MALKVASFEVVQQRARKVYDRLDIEGHSTISSQHKQYVILITGDLSGLAGDKNYVKTHAVCYIAHYHTNPHARTLRHDQN